MKLKILIVSAALLILVGILLKYGNIGTTALWQISNAGKWLLPLVGISALIDSINPCAFSILLLTMAFLFSIGSLRTNILKIGSAYILGIFAVYILIGLGILQTLHVFSVPHFMGKLGASLLILLGVINVLNSIFPKFPIKLHIPHAAHSKMARLMEKGSILTALLLGGLVGLCEFPCTGGPYLMILGLLYDSATYLKGAAYLVLYNVIFVLPLVIILLIASDKTLLEKAKEWKIKNIKNVKVWSGIAMILLGIIIFIL